MYERELRVRSDLNKGVWYTSGMEPSEPVAGKSSPDGFKISAKTSLLSRLSWTPPALVGTRLYIRDRGEMMAVELG